MESSSERSYEDPLGFTKQTATMLVGLGAGDLIPQCRKRNISTQGLASLSKCDLIVLGADDTLADEMLKQLRAAARKYGGRDLSEELRRDQLIKILTGANQQLNLIETFVAYARLRLAETPADFVIDSNKNVRASQALCSAAACTIADVEQLERNFRALASDFTDGESKSMGIVRQFFALLAGIGATAGLVCTLRYASVSARLQ